MNKKKIAVYGVCKNESLLVDRFLESCKDADKIVICDTGSDDNTVELIKAKKESSPFWDSKIDLHQIKVFPWRFDVARNASLSLVPTDIDVCFSLDIDEIPITGWRDEIDTLWGEDTNRMYFNFDVGTCVFQSGKIHSRYGFYWKHMCHEALYLDARVSERGVVSHSTLLRHAPDDGKSRGQYIEMLAASVKEDPSSPRESFYYGRELFFHRRYEEAIQELNRYINMATWNPEKALACRYIGDCYMATNNNVLAEQFYLKAYHLAPERRENSFELSRFYYKTARWNESYCWGRIAYNIHEHKNSWPNDFAAWGFLCADYIAIAAYNLGLKHEACHYGKAALDLNPNDGRLQDNMRFYASMKDPEVINYIQPKRTPEEVLDSKEILSKYADKKKSILILCPSRSAEGKRIPALKSLYNSWLQTTTGNSDFLLGIDEDDKQHYPELSDVILDVNPESLNVIKKINYLTDKYLSNYDYVYFVGDDCIFKTPGWEDKFLSEVNNYEYPVFYGDDTFHGANLCTHAFLSAKIIKKLGFMGPDCLYHYFVDNFWMVLGKNIGGLKYFPDIILQHNHYLNNRNEFDSVYAKTKPHYEDDLENYNKYISNNFLNDLKKLGVEC